MTNKELAEKLRLLIDTKRYAVEVDALHRLIDELDPPKPKVDRSLRGPVVLSGYNGGNPWICIACTDGTHANDRQCGDHLAYTWDDIDRYGLTVRPLTPSDLPAEAYSVEEIDNALKEGGFPQGARLVTLDRLRENRHDT